MGRKPALSAEEWKQLKILDRNKVNENQIAKKLKRSWHAVHKALHPCAKPGRRAAVGRRCKLSPQDKRRIIRHASNSEVSSAQLKRELNLPVSARTVRNVLQQSEWLKYQAEEKVPKLTERHLAARLAFAFEKILWDYEDWKKVHFYDEKVFHCNGPAWSHHYYHDARKGKLENPVDQHGGEAIMVCASISYHGKSHLEFCGTKKGKTLNGEKYAEMILQRFWKDGRVFVPGDIFQQDNASIHKAKKTMEAFNREGFPLLEWPAKSPDLNPIENVWGIMSNRIYGNNKIYADVTELKAAINEAWESIHADEITNLILSVKKRLAQVIYLQGHSIGH